MNYTNFFTAHQVALLHDWLSEAGALFVHLEFPHSGGSGRSFSISSLQDLKELLSEQTHPEVEIFIFKGEAPNDDELDRMLDLVWVYKNGAQVMYVAMKKNRNFYEEYAKKPEKYQEVVAKWLDQA